MKIVTYNILTGGTIHSGDRRHIILKVLREMHRQKIDGKHYPIDVLALQEANDFDTENKSFMQKIKDDLGFEYSLVSKAVKLEGHRYNTVIYSRWPLKEEYDFHKQLSHAGLSAVIDTKELGRIGILSLHLYFDPKGDSEVIRLHELKIVLTHLKRFGKQIVMGDFNSISGRDNYIVEEMDDVVEKRFDVMARCEELGYTDTIAKYLGNTTLEKLRTHPTPTHNTELKKPIRIDHILLKNLKKHLKAAGIHRTAQANLASDHYPVWAIIE